MSAIENDAPIANEEFSGDPTSGFDDFLKRLSAADAEKPSGSEDDDTGGTTPKEKTDTKPEAKEEVEADAEKPAADAEDEGKEDSADESKDDKDEKHTIADDGAYVKVKVGDEEHEVSVKDLQRLYGQEKALTQKSMEVAEQRKQVESALATNVAANSALLERAKARFEPYSKIDFLLAAKELSPEDYTNLRQAALSAHEDVQFLEKNLNGFMQEVQQRQQAQLVENAKVALKVLTGPVDQGGVEGWNEKVYDEVRGFAVKQGLNEGVVNNLVDPVAIRLLHSAMLFERGRSKIVTTRVNKTPKKVIKTTKAPDNNSGPDKSKVDAAMKRLAKTGSQDDAVDAFMARIEASDD